MFAFLDDDQVDGFVNRALEEIKWGGLGTICLNTKCDSFNSNTFYHRDTKLCPCCGSELAPHDLTAQEWLTDSEAVIEHTYMDGKCTGGILHMPYPVSIDLNAGVLVADYKTKRVVKPIEQDWMDLHGYVKSLGSKLKPIDSFDNSLEGAAA
jgi:hypothetical protein